MSKHTPGPWYVGVSEDAANVCYVGSLEVSTDGADPEKYDVEADARLIAAAPEILSVAENFEIKGPDHDDLFWLVLKVGDYGKSFMFNLGHKDEWFASGMIEFEQRRKEVLEKAKGEQG